MHSGAGRRRGDGSWWATEEVGFRREQQPAETSGTLGHPGRARGSMSDGTWRCNSISQPGIATRRGWTATGTGAMRAGHRTYDRAMLPTSEHWELWGRTIVAAARQITARGALRLANRMGARTESSSEPRMLEPILLRGLFGRVGSTLAMQLLGTSPEISFDRAYPSENMSLSNLLYYLQPLRGHVDTPDGYWMDDPDRLWWMDPTRFGFEVRGIPLGYSNLGVDRDELFRRSVHGVWAAYSAAAEHTGDGAPRYYAEKYGGYADVLTASGIPHRMINLVRDPRDVWCSILAFDSKRGYFGFGRREEQSEEEYLSSYLQAMRRRFDEMLEADPATPAITVRYEDLVLDLSGQAQRLSRWLNVDLDPAQALANTDGLGHHRTNESGDASIGRWRQDLSTEVSERIEWELGSHFERFGYARRLAD
jgi:Sulfotransferase family